MARWGQEESKTKGLFGCFFACVILGIAGYTFYLNYDALEQRSELEKRIQELARTYLNEKNDKLIQAVREEAQLLGIELEPEDITIEISRDENYNFVVYYWIDIPFTIDLLITEERISLPITEKVTVIQW